MSFSYSSDNHILGQSALLLKSLLPDSSLLFFFFNTIYYDPVYDFNTIAEGFWYAQKRLGLLEQVVAKNKSAGQKPASM